MDTLKNDPKDSSFSDLEKDLNDDPGDETSRTALIALLAGAVNKIEIVNRCRTGQLSRMESVELYSHLFSVYHEQKKYPELKVIMRDILRIDTNNFTANLFLGATLYTEGEFREAERYLRQAMQLEPGREDCRKLLGETLIKNSSYDEAIRLLMAGISSSPRNPDHYHTIGIAYHNKKDYLNAYISFKNALAIDPNHACIIDIIPTLTAMGRYDEAEQIQDEAMKRGLFISDGFYGKQLSNGLADPMDTATHKDRLTTEHKRWFRTDNVNFFPYDDLCRQDDLEGLLESCVLKDTDLPSEPIFNDNSNLISFGDCFSGHLTGYLQCQNKNARSFNISAGLNNTHALYTFIKWCLTGDVSSTGYWYDKDEHNKIHQWTSKDEHEHYSKLLQNSDGYVFTIGLAEIWKDIETGGVFWRGVPEDIYDPLKHKLILSTVHENFLNLGKLCDIIHNHCPGKPIIFALSPVSLNATFRPVSCIEADCVSKSVLRVAINDLMEEKRDNVYYWPTFEMIRWIGAHLDRPLYGVESANAQSGQLNARHVDKKVKISIAKLFVKYFFHS